MPTGIERQLLDLKLKLTLRSLYRGVKVTREGTWQTHPARAEMDENEALKAKIAALQEQLKEVETPTKKRSSSEDGKEKKKKKSKK
jgi:hypothetical protein